MDNSDHRQRRNAGGAGLRAARGALFGGLATALVFPVLAGGCSKGEAKAPKQVVPVTSAFVTKKSMPVEVKAFGTVEAKASVAVKSQVEGILVKVLFKDGQDLREGADLFKIDSEPYEIAARQAEANLKRDSAQLENARKEEKRQKELLDKKIASRDVYDQAKTAADALDATVLSGSAALDNARLQIKYCTIKAPISGRAGSLMADAGNLVKANDAALITILQTQPIYVTFSVPQRELPEISRQMSQGRLAVKAFIPGNMEPETGELVFIDNTVDKTTGTIRLKGEFANSRKRLSPGLFVYAALALNPEKDAVVVPSRAVQTGQKGTYAYVINDGDPTEDGNPTLVVKEQLVKVARMVETKTEKGTEEETVIAEGLKEGDRVVTDGHIRLTPGALVKIDDGKSKEGEKGGSTEGPKELKKGGKKAGETREKVTK
jgi:membrane fusion protein, multidrug efflux system